MATPMLTQLEQVTFRPQTVIGTYESGTDAAAYLKAPVYALSAKGMQEFEERNPQRGFLATLAKIPGKRSAKISFDIEWKGSGTAGTAPAWIALFNACGNAQTDLAGSASYTQPIVDAAHHNSTAAFTMVISGTSTVAKTGTVNILIKAFTASTSLVARLTFFPNDGTDATTADFTYTSSGSASINSLLAGLTLALGITPTGTASGVTVGDQWNFTVTAAAQTGNVITPIANPNTASPLSMAVYRNGVKELFRDCRGNCKMTGTTGKSLKIHFDFDGIPVVTSGETDSATLTGAAFDATVPPTVMGVTATDAGTQIPCFANLTFDMGVTVAMSECQGNADGNQTTIINKRAPVFTCDPLATLVATENPMARFYTGTALQALIYGVGSVAGNILTITSRYGQLTGLDVADRNGEITRPRTYDVVSPEYDASGFYYPWTITLT